jgi:hypothetical protein
MNTMTKTRPTTRRHVLHCAGAGCQTSITPDPRHIANLTARGAWSCAVHQN